MKHKEFFTYLEHEKRFSPNTLVAYSRDLNQFDDFLCEQYQIQDTEAIRHYHIRSWIVALMKDNISNKSINRKLSCLRSFFKFWQKRGLKINPMKKIVAPKTGKKLPVFVQEADMVNVLKKEHFADDFAGERDRVIMELMYNQGLRRAELIGLKVSDVNFHQNTLKVLGKGNKERLIPLASNMAEVLKEYIGKRKEEWTDSLEEKLFLTNKGAALYPKFLYNLVNKYLRAVPTLEKKSPHVMRHTFATHLANKGADLNAIKELLGHASLAATQVYTHNSIEQLIKVYQNAHPKAEQ